MSPGALEKLETKQGIVGIVGLGYVGLPLARAFCAKNISTVGFDIDEQKIDKLNDGKSYIKHIPDSDIAAMRKAGLFEATSDFSEIAKMDAIIICVPTPLSKHREPDLGPVLSTGASIAPHLQKGQLVVLESSTYPGTTDEELTAVLESSGLKKDKDFFLAYSPEREDPGNVNYETSTIPKIVGADTQMSRDMAVALYEGVISALVPVASSRTAEAIKLTENIFRSVNVALVNELKVIFDAMDIDVWDVIDGASTKPGYALLSGPWTRRPLFPDPFYLSQAREFDLNARFIELAGEINTSMPQYVVSRTAQALSKHEKQALNGARILLVGMAYKKNVDDMRESPSLVLTELLEAEGSEVSYFDPFVPIIPPSREHSELAGRRSIELDEAALSGVNCVLISTDHDDVDYQFLADHARLIIDTRNAMKNISGKAVIVKA